MPTSSVTNTSLPTHLTLPRLFTVKQAGKLLGVTPRTLERWAASGHLPRVEVGPRTIRYRSDDLAALLNDHDPAANGAVEKTGDGCARDEV